MFSECVMLLLNQSYSCYPETEGHSPAGKEVRHLVRFVKPALTITPPEITVSAAFLDCN